MVWKDKGLVTVTGGKLTTFRLLARDALKAAAPYLPGKTTQTPAAATAGNPRLPDLRPDTGLRLAGRYGHRVHGLARHLDGHGSHPIDTTHTLWAELAYGAGMEQVRHLSDLLLRRTRIGLLLTRGGMGIMDRIREQVAPFLDWDDDRWDHEIKAYRALWQRAYSPRGDEA